MISKTHPDKMSADARLDEVARILAAGFLRLRRKEAEQAAARRETQRESEKNQRDNLGGPQRVSSTATGTRSVRGSRLTFRRDR